MGLSYSVISWLADLHSNGSYPYAGVSATDDDNDTVFTYAEWADKIKVSKVISVVILTDVLVLFL